MSARLAILIWQFRHPAFVLLVLGSLALAPLANFTALNNDVTTWISESDPVYQTYEQFRDEFGGGRTLIIAIEGDRLFTKESLEFIREVTEELERCL